MPKMAFGLAFDVVEDEDSAWRPAYKDLGANLRLFAEPRLFGFAAALTSGWAEQMVVTGGYEGRYKDRNPQPARGVVIASMLVNDYRIAPHRVRGMLSRSNTGGNMKVIKEVIEAKGLKQEDCVVLTNHYHVPRAYTDLFAEGLRDVQILPAEAIWLMAVKGANRQQRKQQLIRFFSGNFLVRLFGGTAKARRDAEEIQGIAQKIERSYVPRTDTSA